jgi:hypothetical protein
MAQTSAVMNASVEQIYAVVADGWNYADWVVGAVHIRDVDPDWPQPGSKVHHRIGAWPFTIADSTEVLASDPNRGLKLRARFWPLGEAQVELNWYPEPGGRTRVTMSEHFSQGPAVSLRNKLNDAVLHQRNNESLRRLADKTRS